MRTPSQRTLDLRIERPVAGGRMLARGPDGVVLVAGAIPGELVRVEIERSARKISWARVLEVIEPSGARRDAPADAACGGMAYAHISYPTQLQLKRDVLVDAFRRVGKIDAEIAPDVRGSLEQGYRWRGRFHVQNGRAGFFREGTHRWCDPAPSGQFTEDALSAMADLLGGLHRAGESCDELLLAENSRGTDRVIHAVRKDDAPGFGRSVSLPYGVTGLTTVVRGQVATVAGLDTVSDIAEEWWGDSAPVPGSTTWTRRAVSFFQANRFLTPELVSHVLGSVSGRIADLYAGVGLFAVACAARGQEVVAVEGDPMSGEDLAANAARFPGVRVQRAAVEVAIRGLASRDFDTIIVDPPRTGLSPGALAGVIHLRPPLIVYVSCDPATLARDAKGLVEAGYGRPAVTGFDLFPNTGHVEAVATFRRE